MSRTGEALYLYAENHDGHRGHTWYLSIPPNKQKSHNCQTIITNLARPSDHHIYWNWKFEPYLALCGAILWN